jgi:Domain of unknown function (DUF5658)
MKRPVRPNPDDWASRQLRGNVLSSLPLAHERRNRHERRRRVLWSVLYGSFNPRRRRPPRRLDDSRFQTLDWHGAHVLAVAISILILNVADAFLTVALVTSGAAVEVNPFMRSLVVDNVTVFASLKVGVTGLSVILMVCFARYRFMRVVRVEFVMYVILAAYMVLIGYEVWMLQKFVTVHLF